MSKTKIHHVKGKTLFDSRKYIEWEKNRIINKNSEKSGLKNLKDNIDKEFDIWTIVLDILQWKEKEKWVKSEILDTDEEVSREKSIVKSRFLKNIKRFENFFLILYNKLKKIDFLFPSEFLKNEIEKKESEIPYISWKIMFAFFNDMKGLEENNNNIEKYKAFSIVIGLLQKEISLDDKNYVESIKKIENFQETFYENNTFLEFLSIKIKDQFSFDTSGVKKEIIEKFWNSKIIREIYKINNIEEKRKITEIVFLEEKRFMGENEIQSPKLYNNFSKNTGQLEKIKTFFKNNNTNLLTENDLIFIFENDLFEEKIITEEESSKQSSETIENIKKTIDILWNNIVEEIKKIDLENLKKIFAISYIFDNKEKLKVLLKNPEKIDDFLELERLKKNLKDDLIFLDKEKWYYKELEKLLDEKSKENFNKELISIYSKNNLKNLIYKNKEILIEYKEDEKGYFVEFLHFLRRKIGNIRTEEQIEFKKNKKNNWDKKDVKNTEKKYNRNQKEKLEYILIEIFKGENEGIDIIVEILEKIIFEKDVSLEKIEDYFKDIVKYDRELINELLWENKWITLKKLYSLINTERILENYRTKMKDFYDDDEIKIILDISKNNTKKLELFLNIWKILNKENKENFLLLIDKNIQVKDLQNLYNIFNILKRYNLTEINLLYFLEKLDLENKELVDNINILYKTFKNIKIEFQNWNKQAFVEDLQKFLEDWNNKIINKYIEQVWIQIKLENELDKNLVVVLNKNIEEEIEKTVNQIEKLLSNIFEKFHTSKTSSTKALKLSSTSNFWTWSWSYTRKIRKVLNILKKQSWEKNIDYLNRIKIINFHTFYDNSFITDNQVSNIINNSENKNLGFFDALDNFSRNVIDKIKIHNSEDITKLSSYFDGIIKEELKKIK